MAQPPSAFCKEFADLLQWDGADDGGISVASSSAWRGGAATTSGGGLPSVIVVDFTALTDGAVHNKFDKNAVNDPDAKRVRHVLRCGHTGRKARCMRTTARQPMAYYQCFCCNHRSRH